MDTRSCMPSAGARMTLGQAGACLPSPPCRLNSLSLLPSCRRSMPPLCCATLARFYILRRCSLTSYLVNPFPFLPSPLTFPLSTGRYASLSLYLLMYAALAFEGCSRFTMCTLGYFSTCTHYSYKNDRSLRSHFHSQERDWRGIGLNQNTAGAMLVLSLSLSFFFFSLPSPSPCYSNDSYINSTLPRSLSLPTLCESERTRILPHCKTSTKKVYTCPYLSAHL